MTDPLLALRDRFPILGTSTYLVSNSLGAMPAEVADHLAEYAARWAREGVRAWASGWWRMPVEVGDEVAPVLGAGAGEVAMVPTVTVAHAQVLSALPGDPRRRRIVMTALDFPSVRYAVEALAARLGLEVVVVPSRDGIGIDEDDILAELDERTALLAVSHVLFKSAWILDVRRLCARAREVGALSILDGYHAAGVLPLDVSAIGCDFYAGGVLKWLCGGPGGCFLWADPASTAALRPALTGWQAHEAPFAFDPVMRHAAGAWRWLGGTPVIPALYANVAGPRIVREAGLPAIRAKSQRQTARLVALADARGWRVHAPRDPERRGGTVAMDVPEAGSVAQELLARNVVIDFRPGAGIRVAPHFYTTDAEVERVAAEIDDILATGAWRRHAGHRPAVT